MYVCKFSTNFLNSQTYWSKYWKFSRQINFVLSLLKVLFSIFQKNSTFNRKKSPWKVKCKVRLIESTEYLQSKFDLKFTNRNEFLNRWRKFLNLSGILKSPLFERLLQEIVCLLTNVLIYFRMKLHPALNFCFFYAFCKANIILQD